MRVWIRAVLLLWCSLGLSEPYDSQYFFMRNGSLDEVPLLKVGQTTDGTIILARAFQLRILLHRSVSNSKSIIFDPMGVPLSERRPLIPMSREDFIELLSDLPGPESEDQVDHLIAR